MKNKSTPLFFLFFVFLASAIHGSPPRRALAGGTGFILTEAKNKHFREAAEENVKSYYSQIGLLMGTELSLDDKNVMVNTTCDEYFRNLTVRVANDLANLSQD